MKRNGTLRAPTTPSVLHLIDSAGMYGAERVVLTLMKGLRSSAYKPILGCIKEPGEPPPLIARHALEAGVDVAYFPMRRGLNPDGIRTIARFLIDNPVRVIHSHGYKPTIFLGLLPRRIRKAPVIATVHGWAKGDGTWRRRLYERLEAFFLRRMELVVAVSNGVRRDLTLAGLRDATITTIYNGINPHELVESRSPDETTRMLGLSEADCVVTTIGRLSHEKGHLFLFDALRYVVGQFPNVKLLCVGDGPLLLDLVRYVEQACLTSHVRFTGYRSDIPDLLAVTDIFVLPSTTEGLPISLLEALALGKPTIATHVGGIPEALPVTDLSVLVPPRDTSAIADALIRLIPKVSLNHALSSLSRPYLPDRFSARRMTSQYIRVYDSLIPHPILDPFVPR